MSLLIIDDGAIKRRFRLCSKPYKAHVKDLPWYACNRGVVGTLGRTPRSDLRPLTKRIAYSYAFQLTPTRLSAYGRCNYTDHRLVSVGLLPQEGSGADYNIIAVAIHIRDSARITDTFYFPLFGKNSILADYCRPKVKIHYQKSEFRF